MNGKIAFSFCEADAPQCGHTLGLASAEFRLVGYGDYECPFSARANAFVKALRQRLGTRFSYTYRHFPLSHVHPNAQLAAQAAEAAGGQGRFWEMHELLYADRSPIDRSLLISHARVLGLDAADFIRALDLQLYLARVRLQFLRGIRSGVEGTPTFFLNERPLGGTEELIEQIDSLNRAEEAA